MSPSPPTNLRGAVDINSIHCKADLLGQLYPPFTLAERDYPKDRVFDSISFYEEAKLANDFAFISSSDNVFGDGTAATIETSTHNTQMIIKIATNEGSSRRTKTKLRGIVSAVRRASNQSCGRFTRPDAQLTA
jgi:hypothetical protein